MHDSPRGFRGAIIIVSVALISICAKVMVAQSQSTKAAWPMAGQNVHNTRHQPEETKINRTNVSRLQIKWQKTINASIYATPAVEGGFVYIPDSKGNLYKLDAKTGNTVWQKKLSDYTGAKGDLSRTTPVVTANSLIFGNQNPEQGNQMGAWMLSVGKQIGRLNWAKQVHQTAGAQITQSAVVHDGQIYVGVASNQETMAARVPNYTCCDFRGKIVALEAATGALKRHLYTTLPPSEKESKSQSTAVFLDRFSGAAIWGSTPAVNAKHKLLYITTGNNYTVPYVVKACVDECAPKYPDTCLKTCLRLYTTNYFDSIVALHLDTFEVAWSFSTVPYDAWTVACRDGAGNPQNCPVPPGDDYDFGQGAMLFPGGREKDAPLFVGAAAKSGIFWAWEAKTGNLQWHTQVGPGGIRGGSEWGSAADGERIYVAISNSDRKKWRLRGQGESAGLVIDKGFWSGLDAASGKILWQTPEPIDPPAGRGQGPEAPMTVANGVVFGCSTTSGGESMFALDAEAGDILWRFDNGGSCNAGAAVADGVVYWGAVSPAPPSAYLTDTQAGEVTATLFAFELPAAN